MEELQDYVMQQTLPMQVFFTLVEATAKLVEVSEKYWHSIGQNGARVRILVEIMKEGGQLLPSLLAQKIGVTKANISLLLTPLEKDGLIRRTSHPTDGRKSVISITIEGQSFLLNHLPGNRSTVTEKLKVLTDDELKQLAGLLNKLKNQV
ncbi:MarR family transcriptional regulator [Paenibacillus sp. DXFW5]|uniref:MarR family transcriptional regulator n=1 Tax=Paenibacillus rhizolycopersici TaxID=2780073 RepID=A0ABS2H9E3_9BACL|nr:MarR family transcriptional regulator [Paenibacillus rhizolycopersici]MBM6996629.1 MarR family transcriptional regulator [Paenibacillus rhizolycopersici]